MDYDPDLEMQIIELLKHHDTECPFKERNADRQAYCAQMPWVDKPHRGVIDCKYQSADIVDSGKEDKLYHKCVYAVIPV